MKEVHIVFMQRLVDVCSPFDLVSAGTPDAVIVFGQQTEQHPFGMMVTAADCDSVWNACTALNTWLSSPAWIMEYAPGFVGPIRAALAVRFISDRQILLTSSIGFSTGISVATRGSVDELEVAITPRTPGEASYRVVVPTLLRELASMTDDDFEHNLDAIVASLSTEGL